MKIKNNFLYQIELLRKENIFKTHISKKDHQSLFQLMILNKLDQIFSTRALNDSTFKEAPPTKAPSTSGQVR